MSKDSMSVCVLTHFPLLTRGRVDNVDCKSVIQRLPRVKGNSTQKPPFSTCATYSTMFAMWPMLPNQEMNLSMIECGRT